MHIICCSQTGESQKTHTHTHTMYTQWNGSQYISAEKLCSLRHKVSERQNNNTNIYILFCWYIGILYRSFLLFGGCVPDIWWDGFWLIFNLMCISNFVKIHVFLAWYTFNFFLLYSLLIIIARSSLILPRVNRLSLSLSVLYLFSHSVSLRLYVSSKYCLSVFALLCLSSIDYFWLFVNFVRYISYTF